MAKIGFVGLGNMGLPMAINLLKSGHIVSGFDLQQQAVANLIAEGGIGSESLVDLATDKDVVITMLQTGEQVRDVCLAENGLFAAMNVGAIYIDCSTIDVPTARETYMAAQNYGFYAVDAPVSGGVAGAVAQSLTFMVGGEDKEFAIVKPILNNMGKTVIHAGRAGSGQAAKMCNNMILGVSMVAVSEAFLLAEKIGLSREKLFEVVSSASGQCWVMDKYVPVTGVLDNVPAERDYQPGFSAAMMLKDLKLSQAAADEHELDLSLSKRAADIYQLFNDNGRGNLDFSAIIKAIGGDF